MKEDSSIYIGLMLEEERQGDHKTSNLVSEDIEVTDELKIFILRFIDSIVNLCDADKGQIIARLSDKFQVDWKA